MEAEERRSIARARRELEAARALVEGGFNPQAVSRAYFAAFFAAEAALLRLGETRSKHSGVVSAFGRLLVREGRIEPDSGRLLRKLFERRNAADYGWVEVEGEEAKGTIDDAEQVVSTVSAWLDRT